MEKVIKFNRITDSKLSNNEYASAIVRNEETKVLSINSKNGMTEKQTYQKILSLYRKDF